MKYAVKIRWEVGNSDANKYRAWLWLTGVMGRDALLKPEGRFLWPTKEDARTCAKHWKDLGWTVVYVKVPS